ncbi:MAG: hypothetical protein GX055_05125 [Desulfovibrionales bacterium]|nr:hypothetical protein [Desulfovibrionales bacterium]
MSEIDCAELIEILDRLLPYLQTRKPKGCKDILAELQFRSVPAAVEDEIASLKKLVQAYDFASALDVASTLRNSLNKMEVL